ncbi:MAG: hypothetical protein ABGZ35_12855, partial [Planctomycetaceae bacterium]
VTEPVTFKVIKTIDGDTIDVLTADKKTIRLRFTLEFGNSFFFLVLRFKCGSLVVEDQPNDRYEKEQ